jgi:hypothetical protein
MAAYNPAPIPESGTSAPTQLDPSTQVHQHSTSTEGGSHITGQDKFNAQGVSGEQESVGSAMPVSAVADHDYPNVPETTEPQQGEFFFFPFPYTVNISEGHVLIFSRHGPRYRTNSRPREGPL